MNKELTIIYPSIFNELTSPWDTEYNIAKELGINVCLFDEETLNILKCDLTDQVIIYRGWMISIQDYIKLSENIKKKGGVMFIPSEQYKKANTFSNWYNLLNRYTMKSYFIKDFSKLDDYFNDGKEWFVKDDLKSLGGKKSIAKNSKQAIEIYNQIQENRDFKIENNGICLREVIDIYDEERFFALNGEILGIHLDKDRLKLANQIAKKIFEKLNLVFISIDIGRSELKNILVEVGDFQISDINKEGDVKKIKECYSILKKLIF